MPSPRASTSLLVGLLIGSLACDRKPATPEPDPIASQAAPASEPTPEAEPGEPAAAFVEPPSPARGDAPPSTLEPGVAAPSSAAILAAARPTLGGRLAVAAPPTGFGPRRFATVLRRTEPGDAAEAPAFTILAVLVELGVEGPDAASLVASVELHRWSAPWLEPEDAGKVPTSIVAADFDDDGEAELLVRARLETMCPGGGPNAITHLVIADFAPRPTVALRTELDHALTSGAVETKATVTHEDLDGDGHRDVRIRYVTRSAEPPESDTAENRWLWQASGDAWVRQPTAAATEPPGYDRWGCDW